LTWSVFNLTVECRASRELVLSDVEGLAGRGRPALHLFFFSFLVEIGGAGENRTNARIDNKTNAFSFNRSAR